MPSKSNLSKKERLDLQISSHHRGKKKFSCEICDKSFNQVTKLGDHISAIHEGKKPFKCEICDYTCSKKCHMQTHVASVHEGKKHLNVTFETT